MDPEPETSEPATSGPEAAEPVPADDGRAAQLDELQARADEAARRIDAQRAELDASSEHTARIEREAQAEPEAGRQAETAYDMEIELRRSGRAGVAGVYCPGGRCRDLAIYLSLIGSVASWMDWIDAELALTAVAAMLSPTTLSLSVLALVLGELAVAHRRVVLQPRGSWCHPRSRGPGRLRARQPGRRAETAHDLHRGRELNEQSLASSFRDTRVG